MHDFLCIHPFNDGNGRMSGLQIGKYISLEAKIVANKDLYYATF